MALNFLEQVCFNCGEKFKASRRRNWCSDDCYKLSRARIAERLRDKPDKPVVGYLDAAQRAETAHDAKCEAETQDNVKAWYTERYNERVAKGMVPHIPLSVVLAGVDNGTCSFVPGRVVRCLAMRDDELEQGCANGQTQRS